MHSSSGRWAFPATFSTPGHPRTRPPAMPCPHRIHTTSKGSSGSARSESCLECALQGTHSSPRITGAASPYSWRTTATSVPEV